MAPKAATKANAATIFLPGCTVEVKPDAVIWHGDDFTLITDYWRPAREHSGRASGHTEFTTLNGRRSFDRSGIEDSFYVEANDTVVSLQNKLIKEIAKVRTAQDRAKTLVTIPGFGWSIDPANLETIKKAIMSPAGKTFAPAGMGTAYRMYSGQRGARNRWDNRAKPETEKFFGLGPLYLEQLDWD